MYDSPLFVQIPNTVCHLKDNMAREVLTEIRQFDNLMEQLSAFHHCLTRQYMCIR